MYNSGLQHITNIKVRTLTGDRSGHAKGHMLTLLPSHTCTCKKGDHCYYCLNSVFIKSFFSLEV